MEETAWKDIFLFARSRSTELFNGFALNDTQVRICKEWARASFETGGNVDSAGVYLSVFEVPPEVSLTAVEDCVTFLRILGDLGKCPPVEGRQAALIEFYSMAILESAKTRSQFVWRNSRVNNKLMRALEKKLELAWKNVQRDVNRLSNSQKGPEVIQKQGEEAQRQQRQAEEEERQNLLRQQALDRVNRLLEMEKKKEGLKELGKIVIAILGFGFFLFLTSQCHGGGY